MLAKVATAVDIRCSGSLGSRSVRKQIQALLHFAIGNQKMRVNANTFVPSTAALVISAMVGCGKSIYHKLLVDTMGMLREGTAVLDKQLHDCRYPGDVNNDCLNDSEDISM